jgi:hypothetical protein
MHIMAKDLQRYLSIKEAAERTNLPRRVLMDLVGSGLVEDTLAVGRPPQRVTLYVGEKALARGLLLFEDQLRDRAMNAFRNKCARGLGINAPDEPENNVLDLQEAINSAAKTERSKKKARTA